MMHTANSIFNTPARRILAISFVGTLALVYFAPEEEAVVEVEVAQGDSKTGSVITSSGKADPTHFQREWLLPERKPILDARARPFGTPRPKPVAAAVPTPPPKPLPPPKPVVIAPPLPFQFVGFIRLGNGPKLVQLIGDNKMLSVAPGQRINEHYALDTIEEKQIAIRYLPNNQTQYLRTGRD